MVFFFGLVALLSVLCAFGADENYTDEALHAVERTAVIQAHIPNGEWRTVGSAFAVKSKGEYHLYSSLHIAVQSSVVELRACSTLEMDSCVELGEFIAPVSGLASYAPHTDWAMWRLEALPDGLKPAKLAKRMPDVGEPVCISGAPNGDTGSYTCGRITSYLFGIPVTDAVAIPGNSGGPLWDKDQKVVGIVSAMDFPEGFTDAPSTRNYSTPITELLD